MRLDLPQRNWHRLWDHLPWVIAGILLCWPAFYNGFPLVYSDSGTYINSSFDLQPPPDRPVGYGYFIRIVTWQASLWPVVIAQGLLLSGLIWRVMRQVLGAGHAGVYLLTMACLTVFSSLPWYVSQLMPDIFAGVLILGMALLVMDRLGRMGQFLGMLMVFLACAVHVSHVMCGLALLGIAAIWLLLRQPLRVAGRRWARMALPLVAAVIFLMGNQAANGHGFRLSRSSNLFLAARLAEAGLLEPFLATACETQDFVLCGLGERLPRSTDQMLWHAETSPITTFGSWEAADSAVKPIVQSYFADWGNRKAFLWKGLADGWKQLGRITMTDGLDQFGWDSPPCMAIRWRIPRHTDAFLQARQHAGILHVGALQALQLPLMWISVALIALCLLIGRARLHTARPVAVIVSCGVVLNAVILATLACPVDRYQARISWLLPLLAALLLASMAARYRSHE